MLKSGPVSLRGSLERVSPDVRVPWGVAGALIAVFALVMLPGGGPGGFAGRVLGSVNATNAEPSATTAASGRAAPTSGAHGADGTVSTPTQVVAVGPRLSSPTPMPGATVVPSRPVLPPLASDPPAPDADVLGAVLRKLLKAPALGPSVSAQIVDTASGDVLFSQNADVARSPASTAKLLTSAAALSLLGPQATLATRVVAGSEPGEVVLVGGGDQLLASGRGDPDAVVGHAGLADLAEATAAALREAGTEAVEVRLDDTLFTGADISPNWTADIVPGGYSAPITALAMNAGRLGPQEYARRSPDPAMATAKAFVRQLTQRGIEVDASIVRAEAGPDAEVLAEVRSAALGDVAEFALTTSDNTVAEALARLVAAENGEDATFAGGGHAVLAQLETLGVPTSGATLVDGSGLARADVVPATTLAATLAAATSPEHPELRQVLSGMPVAAASGTLLDRFDGARRAGAGVVRAKTGTLTGVTSLAGTVVDADGRQLVFAVLADRTGATASARDALDAIAVALARCGCR